MPCCGHQLCWVNPRTPTFCPECGHKVLLDLRTNGIHTLIRDPEAWLRYVVDGPVERPYNPKGAWDEES